MNTQTFTITFGDQAENHVGMEKMGVPAKNGFTKDELMSFQSMFTDKQTELFCLNELLPDPSVATEAYVLVVRNGLSSLIGDLTDEFFREQNVLEKDTKAKMYGRVVNKKARHNLCFSDVGHEADYEKGMGTVIAFEQVPLLSQVREAIYSLTGHKLVAEGNYYYDVSKCGIGWHGDSERKVVIGIRVGLSLPLHFRWYHRNQVVSKTLELNLGDGDIYMMSEKAVGFDWKSSSIYTLRHAAGCPSFLK